MQTYVGWSASPHPVLISSYHCYYYWLLLRLRLRLRLRLYCDYYYSRYFYYNHYLLISLRTSTTLPYTDYYLCSYH